MDCFTVLILMILIHVVADFHLQGIMGQMKQKDWWIKQIVRISVENPHEDTSQIHDMYKNDYIPVLLLHGFEWAMLVSLPILYLSDWTLSPMMWTAIFSMGLLHSFIDHLKCNSTKYRINLVSDQILHILQIFSVIWALWVLGC